MPADVKRQVETEFTIADNASGPAQAMAVSMAHASSSASLLQGAIGPLTMAFSALAGFFAGEKIAKAGSDFENTQQQLAGYLKVFGFSQSFTQGLDQAKQAMTQINRDAAALPGEASDYITVFKAGLPALQAATKGNLKDIIAFSNKYAAITNMQGIDAAQAGRDLSLMLQAGHGGAAMHNNAWQKAILPFMNQVEGQEKLTKEMFNKMSSPERFKVLEKTMAQFDEQLGASANTWSAIEGTAKSNLAYFTRIATVPLFEGMKLGLSQLNDMFMDSNGDLTYWGQKIVNVGTNISGYIVDGFISAVRYAGVLQDKFTSMASSPLFQRMQEFTDHVMTAAVNMAMATVDQVSDTVQNGDVQNAAVATLDNLIGIFDAFTPMLSSTFNVFQGLFDIILDASEVIFPSLSAAVLFVLEPLGTLWGGLMGLTEVVLYVLRPALLQLWNATGKLITAAGDVLEPALRITGAAALFVYEKFAMYLAPAISLVVSGLAQMVEGISKFLEFLGKVLKIAADKVAPSEGGGAQAGGALNDFLNSIKHLGKGRGSGYGSDTWSQDAFGTRNAKSHEVPGGRGGGHTTQDFRYSKFDVSQKFAEGFDPDRIAVAFARDVGDIGSRKLQSGFEPMFAVR